VHGEAGKYKEALAAYRRAVELVPDEPHYRYALGWAYGKLARYQESANEYVHALRLKPDYQDAREALEWVSEQINGRGSRKYSGSNPAHRDSTDGTMTRPYQPTGASQRTMAQGN